MKLFIAVFAMIALSFPLMEAQVNASEAEHGHAEEHEHDAKGPHGGIILSEGDLALEVTIYKFGSASEMRVYPFIEGEPVNPEQVDLVVNLHRLGNITDQVSFSAEDDYLVSRSEIAEPHSYEVSVRASVNDLNAEWHYESFEGRTSLSDRIIEQADIRVEPAGPQTLQFKERLFGVIAPVTGKFAQVQAIYSGRVSSVQVTVGDKVQAGQTLATVMNAASGMSYDVVSPLTGEITEQFVSVGEMAAEQVLFEVADLSSVWVELSAFPENIEKLTVGLSAEVFDLHQHQRVTGEVVYIAPVMTGGHIARVRVLIDNEEGHWRPGMHIKADVKTHKKSVPIAVKVDALQTLQESPVVFAQFGNIFEARMVEVGESDGEYVEVTGGLAPNTPYVFGNSYILKADVLKDGASHDH